jgi:DNA (cytosine-5)-methyltransferase 1
MDTEVKRYSIGSLFAGIGGFELGLERAIPGAYTLWQVEQNQYCQKVLAKHWPQAKIYDDVRNITKNNVEQVDILCGGFPCQDISLAGKGEGLHGKKSGLWWEMHRIIDELQPKAVIMENVAAITIRGLGTVLGSLSEIGYDAEWCTIRASDFGAPHRRERWFCVAYSNSSTEAKPRKTIESNRTCKKQSTFIHKKDKKWKEGKYRENFFDNRCNCSQNVSTYSNQKRSQNESINTQQTYREASEMFKHSSGRVSNQERNYWERFPIESPICRRDDGIPHRLDRIAALGNAIVPQCSEWIGRKLWESGILLE